MKFSHMILFNISLQKDYTIFNWILSGPNLTPTNSVNNHLTVLSGVQYGSCLKSFASHFNRLILIEGTAHLLDNSSQANVVQRQVFFSLLTNAYSDVSCASLLCTHTGHLSQPATEPNSSDPSGGPCGPVTAQDSPNNNQTHTKSVPAMRYLQRVLEPKDGLVAIPPWRGGRGGRAAG